MLKDNSHTFGSLDLSSLIIDALSQYIWTSVAPHYTDLVKSYIILDYKYFTWLINRIK